jgi:hypothetical protein
MKNIYLILGVFTMLFSACETDFDVNAEWEETTVVFGLLDASDENQLYQNLWDKLDKNDTLKKSVDKWLSGDNFKKPYKVKLKKHYDIDEIKNLENCSEESLKNIPCRFKELLFTDLKTGTDVHNREIGLGVTQLFPILVEALESGEKIKTIAIEQPELHLHPKLQMEVADEFIRSNYKHGHKFLIETHSEHLLLRIMKRMRHTAEDKEDRDKILDLTPDDVCLLYVDSDGESTYISELELDEDGTLLDPWPNGFFEEGYKERFD